MSRRSSAQRPARAPPRRAFAYATARAGQRCNALNCSRTVLLWSARKTATQSNGSGTDRRRGPRARGGKSGLHRAGRWVTPRRGDPRTAPQKANRPAACGVRVKRWGKSPPDAAVTRHARHTPSGARPNREGGRPGPCLPGRLLEGAGNCAPRGMTVTRACRVDRTRLIVPLPLFLYCEHAHAPTCFHVRRRRCSLGPGAGRRAAKPNSFCPGAACPSTGTQPRP